MTIDYISLPKGVTVPASWPQTPDQDEDKLGPVAQSYFASWKDESLRRVNLLLNTVKVVSVLAGGVALFFVSIPGVILCGAALTVSLIGSSAIWHEKVERCKKVCVRLENWCVELNEALEPLQEIFRPLREKIEDKDSEIEDL